MERHIFDPNQPGGTMSLQNMRNVLRALHQGDFMPLRPRATMTIDDMEYSTTALAAAAFSGTGCTVTTSSATKYSGNYALQVVIDGTGNRECKRAHSLVLTGFSTFKYWDYVDTTASAYQFLIRDASGNESYWNCTTHATISTWKQQSINLSSSDSNNGTNASLATITYWGWKGLDASRTYIFDDATAVCGLQISVDPALISSYYSPIYINGTAISYAGGASPVITPPASNPRIDLLTINSAATLEWTTGAEAATPTVPALPAGKFPIALIYCKTTMTKVVNYEDKDANPNEAYIYKDMRPLYMLGASSFLGLSDTPSSFTASKGVKVNSGATALELYDLVTTFLQLTDCPSSYSGKGGYVPSVNSGQTALEFAYKVGVAASNLVQLTAAAKLPAVDGSLLTNISGKVVQRASYTTGAAISGSVVIPLDDSIPTNSEGTQAFFVSITPINAANTLKIHALLHASCLSGSAFIMALFQDSIVSALKTAINHLDTKTSDVFRQCELKHEMTAGTTSTISFKIRFGIEVGGYSVTVNGISGSRKFGGTLCSGIWVEEIIA